MKTIYMVGPIDTETQEEYNLLRVKANDLGGAYCSRTSVRNKTLTAPSFIFVDKDKAQEFQEYMDSLQ